MSSKLLTKAEWAKTPYAGTKAENSYADITRLLEKYGCTESNFAKGRGKEGREAVMLRFKLHDRAYRIVIETINAPDVYAEKKMRQAERCVFHLLKASRVRGDVWSVTINP